MRTVSDRRGGLVPGWALLLVGLAPAGLGGSTTAESPAVAMQRFELANGLEFILVERPSSSNVAAGWIVDSGSAADPEAAPGVAHLLEHLLFKGTRTIGTRDFNREAPLLEEADRLRAALATTGDGQTATRRRLDQVETELSRLQIPGELSYIYTEAGAGAVAGRTFEDFSVYTVELPAEALELWFWLESDRLLEPVVRELESEIATIEEEQRQRAAAAPGAEYAPRVRAALWGQHPYAQPVLGLPESLRRLRRADVVAELSRRYHSDAITAVLVGRFDAATVERWARLYFGRLERRREGDDRGSVPTLAPPPAAGHDVVHREPERLDLECAGCSDAVEIVHRGPAAGNEDSPALEILAGVLNSRGGRLFREWVVQRSIARSAYVVQHPRRLGGSFRLHAEPAPGVALRDLEKAWYELLRSLAEEPPGPDELERVRARIVRESLDRLKQPNELATQILIDSALGRPAEPAAWAARLAALSGSQLQSAIRRHLSAPPAVVATFRPLAAAGSGEVD